MHLASSSRTLSLLGVAAVVGGAAYIVSEPSPVAAPAKRDVTVAEPVKFERPVLPPALPTITADDEPSDEDFADEDEEVARGMEPITGPEELAMVFEVNGTPYVRLAANDRAYARGKGKLREDNGIFSVVAPVTTSNMPDHLRAWNGREVLVNGTCRARVVGFAEVSRASSEPEGTYDDETGEYTDGEWTVESLSEANVMLAGKLDGCTGTWARAASYPAASVIARVEAPDLEEDAIADLLADNGDDATAREWKEMGGEGDWRDHAEVTSSTFLHPLTNERWIFVQARHGGYCGEPSVSLMAAYRVGESGKVRRFADLSYAHSELSEVVDFDGDGQPELMFGGGDSLDVVDLMNTQHESIYVDSYYHGCGC